MSIKDQVTMTLMHVDNSIHASPFDIQMVSHMIYKNLHVKHMFLFFITVCVLFFKACLLHWKLHI
jgi:hypothetical protein